MALAHETFIQISQVQHGFEHIIIYGIVIFALVSLIKLLWKT